MNKVLIPAIFLIISSVECRNPRTYISPYVQNDKFLYSRDCTPKLDSIADMVNVNPVCIMITYSSYGAINRYQTIYSLNYLEYINCQFNYGNVVIVVAEEPCTQDEIQFNTRIPLTFRNPYKIIDIYEEEF